MLRSLRSVVVAIAAALSLAACGGGDDDARSSAREVLEQTFGATAERIDNARLSGSVTLEPAGLLAVGGPIELRMSGPYAAARRGQIARLRLSLRALLANQRFEGALLSTGRRAYLRLDDRTYEIDRAFVARLRELSDEPRDPGRRTTFGLAPLRWVEQPELRGSERIGGVQTTRVAGEIDVARLLADLAQLLERADFDLLTPQLRRELVTAVDGATVEIWSGAQDRIVRQLRAVVDFSFKDGQPRLIPGLEGGTITLRLRLDDVNATTVDVSAPRAARPFRELADGGLGTFLQGLGSAINGGTSGGDGGAAFLRCLLAADGRSEQIVRCASRLAP